MTETFDIAGYTRISVDDEQEQKNISIENQKAIIEDYVKTHFPGSTLTFFEDRDRSGYTFEQREGYQEMRRGLMSHKGQALLPNSFADTRTAYQTRKSHFQYLYGSGIARYDGRFLRCISRTGRNQNDCFAYS